MYDGAIPKAVFYVKTQHKRVWSVEVTRKQKLFLHMEFYLLYWISEFHRAICCNLVSARVV